MDKIDLAEWQIIEIARCEDDPAYFIETFCWLQQKASAGVSEDNSIIPFEMGAAPDEPHFFQRKILNWLYDKENVLAFKSRRVGCSWIAAAYVAWLINFYENVNCLFISRKGSEAIKILDKVKFVLNNLAYHDHDDIRQATPADWLKGETVTSNTERLSIGWRNDEGLVTIESVAESITTTDDAARGDDATFIIFDELDFYEHPDETWGAATKATTMGGHWMAISTPNTIGRVFHRLSEKGDLYDLGYIDEKEMEFKYIKIHWSHAGITQEMVNRASEGDTEAKKNQEWEWTFLVPGTVVFDPAHLAACYKPPSQHPEIAAALEQYHRKVLETAVPGHPEHGKFFYFGGVDSAKAKKERKANKKDYQAWTVLTHDRIQANAFQSKMPLSKWAGKLIDDGRDGLGHLPGKVSELHREWPGIYWIEEDGPGMTVLSQHRLPGDSFSDVHGVFMRQLFKRSIVERLVLLIESHQIVITDPFTFQCLSVFQEVSPGKYGAPLGLYDDPVLALLLASAALDRYGALSFSFGTIEQLDRHAPKTPIEEHAERFTTGPLLQIDIPGQNRRFTDQMGDLPMIAEPPITEGTLLDLRDDEDDAFRRLAGGIDGKSGSF